MNKTGEKDFNGWMKIKEDAHRRGVEPTIENGEIWWSSIGENVGTKICGKEKPLAGQ